MALFTGNFENKVDGKGRVSLPASFRDELPDRSAGGGQRSFYIFPSPTAPGLEAADAGFIERIAEAIETQTELFSPEEEALSQIIANALPVACDSTGRFVLPPRFQEAAQIKDKALFVGKIRRFQIWSPAVYAGVAAEAQERAKGLTLKMGPSGGAA
ncbi:MAG: hypothetical protein QNJ84_16915 [Alphaproteobacteria bacterium]|nr:hypothetical protein [Alphaproteobacteria bacterium]